MLSDFFKAVVDADDAPVVICNMEHEIVYLNPAAVKRYAKRGGAALMGRSIFECHNPHSKEIILSVVQKFMEDSDLNKVYTYPLKRNGEDSDIYMVALRSESGELIGYYEKHESRIHETDRC